MWAVTALPRIGPRLTSDRLGDLKALIDAAIDDPSYTESRHQARIETRLYPGEEAARVADYLMAKYEELTRTVAFWLNVLNRKGFCSNVF